MEAKCNVLVIFNPICFRYRKYHVAAVLAGDLSATPGVTDGAENDELPLADLPPPPSIAWGWELAAMLAAATPGVKPFFSFGREKNIASVIFQIKNAMVG